MKFVNTVMIFLMLIFYSGCVTKHHQVKEDRKVLAKTESSDVLYGYSKEDILEKAPSSGFYPLSEHLDSLASRIILSSVATKSIKLQYFAFDSDDSGRLLVKSLIDAANRGVKVEVLIDDIALTDKDYLLGILNDHQNITIRSFNPTNYRSIFRYIEIGTSPDTFGRRMHNKAFIVDNSMAVFGGRNIGDKYFGVDEDIYFIDNDVLVAGPFVSELTFAFDTYFASKYSVNFEYIRKANLEDLAEALKEYDKLLKSEEYVHFNSIVKERKFVQMFLNKQLPLYFSNAKLYFDPPNKVDPNTDDFSKFIHGQFESRYIPKKSLLVMNPYFIPDEKMVESIKGLREKGVEVSIVTNSLESTDGKSVYAYYSQHQLELLKMGVKLYEVHPNAFNQDLLNQAYNIDKIKQEATLHAKTMIIDGKYFIIGSRNLDPRSKYLNTEMMAIIKNEELAKLQQKNFELITKPENSYTLRLDCQNNEKDCDSIVWEAKIDGENVTFDSHGDASFMDKVKLFFARLLPIEGLL